MEAEPNAPNPTHLAQLCANPAVAVQEKVAALQALNKQGITAEAVAAFAATFRAQAVHPGPAFTKAAPRAIDVCGTGGDGQHTFNVSTAAGLVLARMGHPVFKHGNRSVTSSCGSADILEAMGVPLYIGEHLSERPGKDNEAAAVQTQLGETLQATNFAFLFAPNYHPAFAHVAPARKILAQAGEKSIFNLLGPLLNPAAPAHQLVGVYAPQWVQPVAAALHSLGLTSGAAVHCTLPGGQGGLDELTCAGTNTLIGAGKLAETSLSFTAADVGFAPCTIKNLQTSGLEENVCLMRGLLGEEKGAPAVGIRQTVALNVGASLWVLGAEPTLQAGCHAADAYLLSLHA